MSTEAFVLKVSELADVVQIMKSQGMEYALFEIHNDENREVAIHGVQGLDALEHISFGALKTADGLLP